MRRLAQIAILLVLAWGCSAKQGSSNRRSSGIGASDGGTSASTDPATGEEAEPGCASLRLTDGEVPAPAPGKSVITFQLAQDDIDPCTVSGYVVGHQDSTSMQSAGNGVYFIPDAPAGDQDIVITAKTKDTAQESKAPADTAGGNLNLVADVAGRGIRLNHVVAVADKRLDLPTETKLLALGQIKGKGLLEGQTDHSGILVAIPGTHFLASTDAAGSFLLDGVVAGEHDVELTKDQFLPGRHGSVTVAANEVTTLPDLLLRLNAGAVGPVVIDGAELLADKAVVQEPLLNLTVFDAGRPVKYKISTVASCPDGQYAAFTSRLSFNVPLDEAFRETGILDTTIYICLLDRDNTPSVLSKAVRVDWFGTRGAVIQTVPALVSRAYPHVPLSFNTAAVTRSGTEVAAWVSDAVVTEAVAVAAPTTYRYVRGPLGAKLNFDFDDGSHCGVRKVQTRLISAMADASLVRSVPTANDLSILCSRDATTANRPDLPFADLGTYPTAAWTGDSVFFWGGPGARAMHHEWSPITDSWQVVTETNAPSYRDFPFLVRDSQRLLVFGSRTNRLKIDGGIYDRATGTWQLIPDAPFIPDFVPEVQFDGHLLWLFCPDSEEDSGQFAAFRPEAGTWQTFEVPDAFFRRFNMTMSAGEGRVAVYGGYPFKMTLKAVAGGAYLNAATRQWTTFPTLNAPSARANAEGVISGGKFWIWGGDDDSYGTKKRDGAVFDFGAGTWAAIPEAPVHFSPARLEVVDGQLVVQAGNVSGDGTTANTQGSMIYNPSTGVWRTTIAKNHLSFVGAAASASQGVVYTWPSVTLTGVQSVAGSAVSSLTSLQWLGFEGSTPEVSSGEAGAGLFVYQVPDDSTVATPLFVAYGGRSPLTIEDVKPLGRASSSVSAGELVSVQFTVRNGVLPSAGGTVTMSVVSGSATLTQAAGTFPALAADAKAVVITNLPKVTVAGNASPGSRITVKLDFTSQEGVTGSTTATFFVRTPGTLVLTHAAMPSDSGASRLLELKVRNTGDEPLTNVVLSASGLTCVTAIGAFPAIAEIKAGESETRSASATMGACDNGDDAAAATVSATHTGGSASLGAANWTVAGFIETIVDDFGEHAVEDTSNSRTFSTVEAGTIVRVRLKLTAKIDALFPVSTFTLTPPGGAPIPLTLPTATGVYELEFTSDNAPLNDLVGDAAVAGDWDVSFLSSTVDAYGESTLGCCILEVVGHKN